MAPPAILIGVSLAVFFVVQFVVNLPLKLTQRRKLRRGRTDFKQVNRPDLSLKL